MEIILKKIFSLFCITILLTTFLTFSTFSNEQTFAANVVAPSIIQLPSKISDSKISIHHKLDLHENISVKSNDNSKNIPQTSDQIQTKSVSINLTENINVYTNENNKKILENIKHESEQKAIFERIFPKQISDNYSKNSQKSIRLIDLVSNSDSNTNNYFDEINIEKYSSVNFYDLNFIQISDTIFSVEDQNFDHESLDLFYLSINSFVSVDNGSLLIILLPIVSLVFFRSENQNPQWNQFRRFFSFVLIIILSSSLLITPLSVSNGYWGMAYGEEFSFEGIMQDSESVYSNTTSTEPVVPSNTTSTQPVTTNTTSTEPVVPSNTCSTIKHYINSTTRR
jgi:hypothetical protein